MLVVVLVLENPDRFAIRLTEQISSIGLFAVTESQCTEDEHDDEDEDDSKFRNLGFYTAKMTRRFRTELMLLCKRRNADTPIRRHADTLPHIWAICNNTPLYSRRKK